MSQMIGKPSYLKQVNLSLVRKAIHQKGSATRAEIVDVTKISVTTVRTLLTELLENGEIVKAGYDESIGGRKAVRYQLVTDRFFGVAMCLGLDEIHYITVNICGDIKEQGVFAVQGDVTESICNFLDTQMERIEIRSIGLGVPGIVNGLKYIRKNALGQLESHPIGEVLSRRYGLPVILENDLNAITLGFGCCYLKTFPEETCENVNMAYISFEPGCLSAGFLANGRILRGFRNYVGELGLFPMDEARNLDDVLALPLSDREYAQIAAKVIAAVCCILNPEYVALGGKEFREDCLPLITEHFYGILPDAMCPEILYAKDKWHDYYEGLAYLTAEQIFAEVQLIRD